ncbi:MAG: type II toxin-antitoxin system HicA family toxin [Planctomycetota bacterium]|nr:type II toxin-antitoxin system HicA family toxin [Planctomycetota bacterium]
MPSEVRFADVRRELERHGWTLVRISGSHHIFLRAAAGTGSRSDEPGILSIPVHRGKVKAGYVGRIEKSLGIKIR